MNHRLARTAVVLSALTLLVGCSSPSADEGTAPAASEAATSAPEETEAPPAAPLDLNGAWKQVNSNSADTYQQATIADGVISIDWVNAPESSTAVYWVGTYAAPTDAADNYAWQSQGDTAAMQSAILASGDATKDFTYEGGVLKYELTAMGVTMTVEMQKQ